MKIIDAATGLVEWPEAVPGTFSVRVAAEDPLGAGANQGYTIFVRATNSLPTILGAPPATAVPNATYQFVIQAQDFDGDLLTYSLNHGPAGMRVNEQSGLVTRIPTTGDLGSHDIQIDISDPFGATPLRFTVDVGADTIAPNVSISLLPTSDVAIGTELSALVSAVDNLQVVHLELTRDGVPLTLDASGRVRLATDTAGVFELIGTATDAAGNVGQQMVAIHIRDPSDASGPVVAFTSPAHGDVIDGPVDVIGTVSDDTLLFYTLSVAPLAGGAFFEIARGTSSVTEGVLGKFDPSTLPNDSYILQLYAIDAGGNETTEQILISVAGDLKLGNFSLSFTDLSIPLLGVPISLTRTYDSQNS